MWSAYMIHSNDPQTKFQYNICTCGAFFKLVSYLVHLLFQYNICTCGASPDTKAASSAFDFNTTFVHVEPSIGFSSCSNSSNFNTTFVHVERILLEHIVGSTLISIQHLYMWSDKENDKFYHSREISIQHLYMWSYLYHHTSSSIIRISIQHLYMWSDKFFTFDFSFILFQYNICTCGAYIFTFKWCYLFLFQYNICTCGAYFLPHLPPHLLISIQHLYMWSLANPISCQSYSYFNTTFVHVEQYPLYI